MEPIQENKTSPGAAFNSPAFSVERGITASPTPNNLILSPEPNPIDPDKIVEWNDKIEESVKRIGELCEINKLMHMAVAQSSDTKHSWLMYGGILLGPLGSSIIGIGLLFDSTVGPSTIAMITGYMSGIVIAIIKYGKFDDVSNNNKAAVARYSSMEMNVRRQLSLYRKDRLPAREYLEWLNKSYEDLFMASPLLPYKLTRKYNKMLSKDENKKIATIEENSLTSFTKVLRSCNPRKSSENIEIAVNNEERCSEPSDITGEEDVDLEHGGRVSITGQPPEVKRMVSQQFTDLSKFGDGMLNYEMKRFMNNKHLN